MRSSHISFSTRAVLINLLASTILAGTVFFLAIDKAGAQTYLSVEAIPSASVVGPRVRSSIDGLGYSGKEKWTRKIERECHFVSRTIKVLIDYGMIRSGFSNGIKYSVAAGWSNGVTADPSYIFGFSDKLENATGFHYISILDNALGFVLSQPDNLQFTLQEQHRFNEGRPFYYAVVRFPRGLTGLQAVGFHRTLGRVDESLALSEGAGTAQIRTDRRPSQDAIIFLKGNISHRRFLSSISLAAKIYKVAYFPLLRRNDRDFSGLASVVYFSNDWTKHPRGDEYLARIPILPAPARQQLDLIRKSHLYTIQRLTNAIESGKIKKFLARPEACGNPT